MVDMAAIAGAATSLKTAIDISKIALGLRDESLIRTKILEMQGEISSALAGAIAAQTDQLVILKRVDDLEKEVAQLKAWNAEKQNYDLKPISRGTVAYMLKPEMRGAEPPHWLCTHCYESGKREMLQLAEEMSSIWIYQCPGCGGKISVPSRTGPSWI